MSRTFSHLFADVKRRDVRSTDALARRGHRGPRAPCPWASARPRRQIDFAPLCPARRPRPRPDRTLAIMRPAPTASRRSTVCAGSASTCPPARTAPLLYWDEAEDRLRSPAACSKLGIPGRRCGCCPASLAATRFRAVWSATRRFRAARCAESSTPLERMGARIEATDGHAPLVIHGDEAARELRSAANRRAPR